MKKLLLLFVFIFVVSSSSVLASDNVQNVVFDGKIIESEKMIYNNKTEEEAEVEKFKKEKDAYTKKGIDESFQSPVISTGEKYKNAVINMEAEFDFTTANGEKSSYDGFMLRGSDTEKVCHKQNCYVVIIREDSVEIQIFSDKKKAYFLLNEKTEIPKNEKVKLSLGTIDTTKGVYVFIKINDKVYSGLDTENCIPEEGYFNLEMRGGMKVYPILEENIDYIPLPEIEYDVDSGKIKSEITDVFGEKKDLTYKWFLSKDGQKPAKKSANNLSEIFEEVEGENFDSFIVMDNDIGKYAYLEVSDGKNTFNSAPIYISASEYSLKKDFITVIGYDCFMKNGEKFVFDKDNNNVYADEKDGLCYLPIRGIADAYGWPIAWNGEEKTVSMAITTKDVNNVDTMFKIGQQGFIVVKQLMAGVAMNGTPYLHENRSFLDSGAVQELIDCDYSTYDKETGLLILSTKKLTYTPEEIKLMVDSVTVE